MRDDIVVVGSTHYERLKRLFPAVRTSIEVNIHHRVLVLHAYSDNYDDDDHDGCDDDDDYHHHYHHHHDDNYVDDDGDDKNTTHLPTYLDVYASSR